MKTRCNQQLWWYSHFDDYSYGPVDINKVGRWLTFVCDTHACRAVVELSITMRAQNYAQVPEYTRNSSGDETANVNFYDDIAHVLPNTKKENLLR